MVSGVTRRFAEPVELTVHQPEALLNPSPSGADQDGARLAWAWRRPACLFPQSAPTEETGRLVWVVVVQQFLLCREGRRETTLRDLRTRMARTLEVLPATPRPVMVGR